MCRDAPRFAIVVARDASVSTRMRLAEALGVAEEAAAARAVSGHPRTPAPHLRPVVRQPRARGACHRGGAASQALNCGAAPYHARFWRPARRAPRTPSAAREVCLEFGLPLHPTRFAANAASRGGLCGMRAHAHGGRDNDAQVRGGSL